MGARLTTAERNMETLAFVDTSLAVSHRSVEPIHVAGRTHHAARS